MFKLIYITSIYSVKIIIIIIIIVVILIVISIIISPRRP